MDMRKYILTAAATLICAATFAQTNLNPTVEVTNTYQGDPSEVHKPQIGMAIPDSLLRFDMDFGYEVFQKPYQGAYNFKPYMLAMTPEKNAYRGRKLYLKAGAGYSLHPQLDVVFSPEQKGPFQMSVYANHRSYWGKFGRYNALQAVNENGVYNITKIPKRGVGGYDAVTSVGFEGKYAFETAILSFGAGYYGLMAKDTLFKRSFNAADFNVRIRSNLDDERYIFYDVALNGRFAGDARKSVAKGDIGLYDYAGVYADNLWNNLSESFFLLKGNAGPVLDANHAALIGFEAETCSYGNLYGTNAGRLALIPKYQMKMGALDLSLGIRAEVLLRGKVDESAWYSAMHQYKGAAIFPDIHVRYTPAENVSVYASATGGNNLNTYSSLLERNHFLNPGAHLSPLMDNSTEKINIKAGVEGNVGNKIQVEVDGGFAVIGNGVVDSGVASFSQREISSSRSFIPLVAYSDYNLFYADASVDFKGGNFNIDGGLHLRGMDFKYDSDFGLALPPLTFDFQAVYNFSPRVYAGLRAQASGARKGRCIMSWNPVEESYEGCDVRVPGWLDLGLLGGWRFNRKIAFWVESGNLLCETIQKYPFYSEKDLWITAGITLNL